MTPEHELVVKARAAGRAAANELADLYVGESARLLREHGVNGLEASIVFLESLRDALVMIRPFQKTDKALQTPLKEDLPPASICTTFNSDEAADGYTLVEFNDIVEAATDKAILIDGIWIPKSVLEDIPEEGDHVEQLSVKSWFATKESLV